MAGAARGVGPAISTAIAGALGALLGSRATKIVAPARVGRVAHGAPYSRRCAPLTTIRPRASPAGRRVGVTRTWAAYVALAPTSSAKREALAPR